MAEKIIDLTEPDKIALCVYGITGSGKSHFCATATQSQKTYYMNTEEKTAVLKKFAKDFEQTKSKAVWVDSVDEAQKVIRGLNKAIENNKPYPECVVLDSVSRFQLHDQLDIMSKEIPIEGDKKKIEYRDETTYKDFGKLHVHMNRAMILIPKKYLHVIVTAQAMEYNYKVDGGNTISRYKPALVGQFGNLFGGWFNILAFLEVIPETKDGVKTITHRLHFQPGDNFDAKTEFDLPDYLDNPTFGDIVKLVNGK